MNGTTAVSLPLPPSGANNEDAAASLLSASGFRATAAVCTSTAVRIHVTRKEHNGKHLPFPQPPLYHAALTCTQGNESTHSICHAPQDEVSLSPLGLRRPPSCRTLDRCRPILPWPFGKQHKRLQEASNRQAPARCPPPPPPAAPPSNRAQPAVSVMEGLRKAKSELHRQQNARFVPKMYSEILVETLRKRSCIAFAGRGCPLVLPPAHGMPHQAQTAHC